MGARDLIESGINGFVLEENPSAFDFSEKLSFLLTKENRRKMGENARQIAWQHTWDKVVDKVENFYYMAVGGKTS